MGSLYQRGKKGIWWLQYFERGKRIRESSYSERKSVAKKLLEIREGAIAQGRASSVEFEKTTFDELSEYFLKDYASTREKPFAALSN